MDESVIDFPKETLCKDIWEKVVSQDGINEVWQLKSEVRELIQQVYNRLATAIQQVKLDIVHITGSITSNSFTENADVDIHFLTSETEVDEILAEEINKELRILYSEKVFINKHPIEVYFQPNKYQDLMSVGCYDFFKNKWLVGPDFTNQSFNPYKEYFSEIQIKSEQLAQQIRNMIFSIYEIAIVYKKNLNTDFSSAIRSILINKLQHVQELYDNMRAMRKVYSSPESEAQALQYRTSRKWKIADASFKLFDKYGYIAILKQFIEDYKLISTSDSVDDEIIEDILATVKKYINNADKLAEQEFYEDDEQLDEGILQNITLAALLAIPAIMPEQAIAKQLKQLPKTEQRANSKVFQKTVQNFSNEKVGNFSMTNAVNILAWTLYGEANNQSKKGKEAVASTIYNRAGGNKEKILKVILAPAQYSTWNKDNPWGLKTPTSDNDWTYKPPKATVDNKLEAKSWNDCVSIASKIFQGTFKSTIGTRNSYLNKDVVAKLNPSVVSPTGWGTKMSNQLKIGDHTFGYLKNNDGFKQTKKTIAKKQAAKQNANIYSVKNGDTLYKIAKKYKTTPEKLAAKNNINVNSVIKIGQKLII